MPIGLYKLIKPLISCTPFIPPYWFNNIGNKLITNAIVNIIFFFIKYISLSNSDCSSFSNTNVLISVQ